MTTRRKSPKRPPAWARVTMIGDVPHSSAIGTAVRLGLADPSREVAAELYPLLELAPGEERAKPGELAEGLPVFAWIPQASAAEFLGLTPRQVQNLEAKGLPSKGARSRKRYALPHLVIWHDQYTAELRRHRHCEALPFRVALARHRLERAEAETEEETTSNGEST
jgi:hypothetical protein